MPQLRAEIAYNQPDSPKSWKFSASAQGMPMIALGPLFGDEKDVVMEMLGHIKLVDVCIAYNFSGESASGLSLNAKVNIGLLQLQLSYDRGTARRAVPPSDPKDPSPPDLAGKETGWALLMSLKAAPDATADKLTVMLRDLIGDLLGPDCAEALPSFIGDTQLNFKESHLEVKLNSRKIAVVGGETPSTSSLVLSCEVVLGNIMLQFCSLGSMSEASPPEPVARPDDKPSSPDKPSPGTVSTTKRLIRITTLLPFLNLPEMPAIGPIQLPFEGLSFIWASRDFTTTEVAMINERAFTSSKIQVLLSDTGKGGDGSPAAPEGGISLKAGCHLMLINESKVPLVGCHFGGGTPSSSGPKDQLGKKPEVPTASSGSPDVKPTTNARSRNTKAISSPSRMRPMKKKIGAISISNIGLAYNAGKLSVQVDAQATIGPLQCALDGFSIDLDLQNVTGFDVSQLEKIDVDVSLLGLGIAYNGPSVAIAGLLKRIGEEGREGFLGGVIASVTPYSLIAYGSCTEVQKPDGGGSFKSMFVYVSFQGPILKTPYVELLGIRGGFGYNSQLRLPDITQMDNFPFIKRTDTSNDPMGVLESLSSPQDNQQAWITEQEGSLWFAAGLTIRALEILDVTALVTLQLGQTPADTEIGIMGTAEACLPATKDCSKALAYIKLNVLAQIKPSSGVFRIDGLISPDSYILHKECRPTGGFMVIAYYSGEYDGDFCVSFGGFHPAFRKPVQYPDPPPRLGISWTIGEHLSIRGQAYMAATPTAFMTGCMLSASYNQGDISAYFDACADFILNYHPVHYNVSVIVHASVSYEFTKFFIRKKISVGVDAELCLYGPPMAGYVHFNVWVFSINVPFGERYEEPKALTLKEFVDLMNEKHEKDSKDSQLSPHILSVDSGMLPTKESTKPDPEPPLWLVRRNNFVFRVCSRIAISTVLLNRPDDYDHNKPDLRGVGPIRSQPMQLDSNMQLESVLSIRLLKAEQNGVFKELDIVGETGFNSKRIESNVPVSFWGEWHEGLDLLSEPKSTMRHLMGVILCPSAGSGAQSIPASTAPLTELEDAVESVSKDYVKELIDPVSVENPFGVAAIAGTDVEEKVSVRMKEIKALAQNRAGEWSKNRAGVLKMFSDRLEKSRPKQAKALKGLSAAVPQKLFKDPRTWYPMPPRIGSQVVVSTVG